jgi:hypothetical protein
MIISFKKTLRERMALVGDTKDTQEMRLAIESAMPIVFDLDKLQKKEPATKKAA